MKEKKQKKDKNTASERGHKYKYYIISTLPSLSFKVFVFFFMITSVFPVDGSCRIGYH